MTTTTLAEKLRAFAKFLDNHPALEEIPEVFKSDLKPDRTLFCTHLFGDDDPALIDRFAEIHGVTVKHTVHGPNAEEPGARYSSVETMLDGIEFRLQAHTGDYEKATGKTVPLPPEEVERRMLAEVEHWSNTPMPGGAS